MQKKISKYACKFSELLNENKTKIKIPENLEINTKLWPENFIFVTFFILPYFLIYIFFLKLKCPKNSRPIPSNPPVLSFRAQEAREKEKQKQNEKKYQD